MRVDFHVHTSASDGMLEPASVFSMAKGLKLDGLAITDHDTISAVAASKKIAKELDMLCISGLELSCNEDGTSIHVLAYGLDYNNRKLLSYLAHYRKGKLLRLNNILNKLSVLGLPITVEELGVDVENPNRVHIARVMVRKNYVKSNRQAFNEYLGKGEKAYFSYEKPSASDGIKFLNEIGAVTVIAHPSLIKLPREEIISNIVKWKALGLDGIEAYHPSHSYSDNAFWYSIARSNGLLVTGGSDFHCNLTKSENHGFLGQMLPKWVTAKQDTDTILQFIKEEAYL